MLRFLSMLISVEIEEEIGVSTSDPALNRARPCTRVGPMGHESHAGPRSRTTHAPALTPDLTLSTECRFIIGHKLRRKNLGELDTLLALGFAFYWDSDFLFSSRALAIRRHSKPRIQHSFSFSAVKDVYSCK